MPTDPLNLLQNSTPKGLSAKEDQKDLTDPLGLISSDTKAISGKQNNADTPENGSKHNPYSIYGLAQDVASNALTLGTGAVGFGERIVNTIPNFLASMVNSGIEYKDKVEKARLDNLRKTHIDQENLVSSTPAIPSAKEAFTNAWMEAVKNAEDDKGFGEALDKANKLLPVSTPAGEFVENAIKHGFERAHNTIVTGYDLATEPLEYSLGLPKGAFAPGVPYTEAFILGKAAEKGKVIKNMVKDHLASKGYIRPRSATAEELIADRAKLSENEVPNKEGVPRQEGKTWWTKEEGRREQKAPERKPEKVTNQPDIQQDWFYEDLAEENVPKNAMKSETSKFDKKAEKTHGTDISNLEEILSEGVRPGSAIDSTADRSWSREYPVTVDASGAELGAKIEHNNYWNSANTSKPKWVEVDFDQFDVGYTHKEIYDQLHKLSSSYPNVEFRVKIDGKTKLLSEMNSPKTKTVKELEDEIGAYADDYETLNKIVDAEHLEKRQKIEEIRQHQKLVTERYRNENGIYVNIPRQVQDFVERLDNDIKILEKSKSESERKLNSIDRKVGDLFAELDRAEKHEKKSIVSEDADYNKTLAEEHGVVYNGETKFGNKSIHMFTEPTYGATISLKAGENLRDKIAAKRKEFEDSGNEPIISKDSIHAGINPTATKARLLKDALGWSPERTVVNELLQNSFDATRDNAGEIAVEIRDGSVTVKDTGKGMSPDVARKDFVTLFEQGSKTAEDMGGFGLAKLPILGWPDSFDVITVGTDNAGVKHKSHIWGTKEDFMEKHTVNFESSKVDASTPTGTTVTINKSDLKSSYIQDAVSSTTSSLRSGQNVKIFDYTKDGLVKEVKSKKFEDLESIRDPLTVEHDGSKVTIKFVKVDSYGWGEGPHRISTRVYNKGLILPDIPQYTSIGKYSLSRKPNFEIEINFEKTPAASADNYPFLVNRTRLAKEIESTIGQVIHAELRDIERNIGNRSKESLIRIFDNAPKVGKTKIIVPFEDTNIVSKVSEVINKYKDTFDEIGTIFDSFSKILDQRTDIHNHEYAITTESGVHGFRPKSGILSKDYIVVNPFTFLPKEGIKHTRKTISEVSETDIRTAYELMDKEYPGYIEAVVSNTNNIYDVARKIQDIIDNDTLWFKEHVKNEFISLLFKDSNSSFSPEILREAANNLIQTLVHEAAHVKESGHGLAFVRELHNVQKSILYDNLKILEDQAYEVISRRAGTISGITRDVARIQRDGKLADVFSDFTPEERVVAESSVDAGRAVYEGQSRKVPENGIDRSRLEEPVVDKMAVGGEKFHESVNNTIFNKYFWTVTDVVEAKRLKESGADRDTIYDKTGWWEGQDGKWRMEINPDKIKFNEDIFNKIKDSLTKPVRDLTSEEKNLALRGTLKDILDAPEIFKAFPEYGDYRVKVQAAFDDPLHHQQGWFNTETKELVITPYCENPRSTAIHELQHAIQGAEDFAAGSSPEAMPYTTIPTTLLDKAVDKTLKQYKAAVRDQEVIVANAKDKVTSITNLGKILDEYLVFENKRADSNRKVLSTDAATEAEINNWSREIASNYDSIKNLFKLAGVEKTHIPLGSIRDKLTYDSMLESAKASVDKSKTALEEAKNKLETFNNADASTKDYLAVNAQTFDLYRKVYGEAEARMTSIRDKMTADERANERPYETMERMLREEGLLEVGERLEDAVFSINKDGELLINGEPYLSIPSTSQLDRVFLDKVKSDVSYEKLIDTLKDNGVTDFEIKKGLGRLANKSNWPTKNLPSSIVADEIIKNRESVELYSGVNPTEIGKHISNIKDSTADLWEKVTNSQKAENFGRDVRTVWRGLKEAWMHAEDYLGKDAYGKKAFDALVEAEESKNRFLDPLIKSYVKATHGIRKGSDMSRNIGEALDGTREPSTLNPRERKAYEFFKEQFDFLIHEFALKSCGSEESYRKVLSEVGKENPSRMKVEDLDPQSLKEYEILAKQARDLRDGKRVRDLDPDTLGKYKDVRQQMRDFLNKSFLDKYTPGERAAHDILSRRISNYLPHIFDAKDMVTMFTEDLARARKKFIKADDEYNIAVLNKSSGKELAVKRRKRSWWRNRVNELEVSLDKLNGGEYPTFQQLPKQLFFRFFSPRKGKEGYSTDALKAYETYVYGLARKMYDEPAIRRIAEDLYPKIGADKKSYVKAFVDHYMGYDKHPLAKLANTITTFEWMRTLGLNPRSAVVNLSQRINTLAYIGEKYTLRASKMLVTDREKALEIFNKSGIAREVPNVLMEGETLQALEGARKIAGIMFDNIELGNRRHAYLSGYLKGIDVGKSKGLQGIELETFAQKMGTDTVHETQFRYGKLGMPKIYWNPAARVFLQFSSYPLKQARFLYRLGKKDPVALLKYMAYAEGINYTLQNQLDTDMSNALGIGISWSEAWETVKRLVEGDTSGSYRHATQIVRPGAGLLPSGPGPLATGAIKVVDKAAIGKGLEQVKNELTPVMYSRLKQAVESIASGPDKNGKYLVKDSKGHGQYRLTLLQLLRRTAGPRTSVEYEHGKNIEMSKQLEIERKQAISDFAAAVIANDKDELAKLAKKHKNALATLKRKELVKRIKAEIVAQNTTYNERRKTGAKEKYQIMEEGRIY